MIQLRSLLISAGMAVAGFVAGFLTDQAESRRLLGSPARGIANDPVQIDPVATVFGALQEENSLRMLATLGALVDPLDAAQWRRLLDQVEGLPESERERLLPRLIAVWSRLDPKAATEWIRPRLDIIPRDYRRSLQLAVSEWRFIGAWAANAPEEAIEYARTVRHNPDLRLSLLYAAGERSDKDYAKAFESLRDFSSAHDGDRTLSSLTRKWAETDRDAAFAAAISLPQGLRKQSAIGGVLEVWAENDPAKALELATAHGVTDSAILARIFVEVAKGKPTEAAAWLENHATGGDQFRSQLFATTWAHHDAAAALKWAVANGVSVATPLDRHMVEGMFNGTGESPLWAANRKDPNATIAFVESMPPGEERTRCIQLLAPMILDIEKLKSIVGKLPPEVAHATAASAAGILYIRDSAKGLAWVETLSGEARRNAWMQIGKSLWRQQLDPSLLPPAGPDRDALISGEVSARGGFKPAQWLPKAVEITDPSLRQETLHYVFTEVFRKGDGAGIRAASEWLEKANIPEDWKKKWRQ
jgi:hypothetical protein